MQLNERELASVLAALRLWQRDGHPNLESFREEDHALSNIATDEGSFDPLDPSEIDALCERLNFEPDDPDFGVYDLSPAQLKDVVRRGMIAKLESEKSSQ